jgi:hypothetical protein
LIFAIVGFNSPPLNEVSQLQGKENTQTATFLNSMPVNASVPTEEFANPDPTSPVQSNSSKVIQEKLRFPGLNKFGLPTGFTVADSTGALGTAYFRERTTSSPSSYLSTSQIIKTESGAANIFIAQNVSSEGNQIGYSPSVSFGKSGEWAPLLVSVTKSETRRLSDGNHLFTAYIAVQSEVESPIRITAKANGRDLDVAPSRVITRLVLDPSRTIVLSQAIYVIESKAGA